MKKVFEFLLYLICFLDAESLAKYKFKFTIRKFNKCKTLNDLNTPKLLKLKFKIFC